MKKFALCIIKTANRKQQKNTDNVLLLVINCDIKLEILNKLGHCSQSVTMKTVMSELFFCEGFSVGHVIITTIIIIINVMKKRCLILMFF